MSRQLDFLDEQCAKPGETLLTGADLAKFDVSCKQMNHNMCNCKKSHCRTLACGCKKKGKECNDSCKCVDCQNTPETKHETPKPLESNHPFELPLAIYSWNLCNFAAVADDFSTREKTVGGASRQWTETEQLQLRQDTKRAFGYLGRVADILVVQEFRFQARQVDLLLTWLGGEFDHAAETQDLEYVFFWRRDRVEPFKHPVDRYIHGLIKEGLKRAVGTMRFKDKDLDRQVILSTFHLKSGGGRETKDEYAAMLAGYDKAINTRYGEDADAKHVLVGDFNFNPHSLKPPEQWRMLGDKNTITSSGGKGLDFFFTRNAVTSNQNAVPLVRPKNSALSDIGISDHYPIYILLF